MLIGQKIGPFQIDSELGSGAMGSVYKARFDNKGKILPVALKVISLGLLGNDSALARFDREANILKQLKHPHIVRLYATGRYKQTPFIAMEFVDGEPLDRVLSRKGRLSWEEVLEYGKQLCQALQHAHDKGIIHRDLKPSNLMITREGALKLADFGIAKDADLTNLTGTNSTIGTAAYMSPEQCRGLRDLGARSDLYSLGVVFYELITGKKPFYAENTVEMFLKHVNEVPVRPSRLVNDLPVWMDNLIMFLMEKLPEQRPLDAATVGRMLADIEEKVLAQQSIGAEAANARRIDRPVSEKGIDQADLEAARALKQGKKKKRKKKKVPLSEQKWPKAVGLITMLCALIGFAVWLAWPQSLDAAYEQFEQTNAENKLVAAQDFLQSYGTQPSEKVKLVQDEFRKLRTLLGDRQLQNRYSTKMFKPQDNEDAEAIDNIWAALDSEESGNLKRAKECWNLVKEKISDIEPAQYTDESAVRQSVWRWVAEKHIQDINGLPSLLGTVEEKIKDFRLENTIFNFEPTDPEGLAIRATRLKLLNDLMKARKVWESLARETELKPEYRNWYLLANQQVYLLPKDTENADKQSEDRLILVTKIMNKAQQDWQTFGEDNQALLQRRSIRVSCRDILQLYDDETSEAMKALLSQAKSLLQKAESSR